MADDIAAVKARVAAVIEEYGVGNININEMIAWAEALIAELLAAMNGTEGHDDDLWEAIRRLREFISHLEAARGALYGADGATSDLQKAL